jgi:vacuolar-type H+-ATPase subunit B/Vma2
MFVHTASDPVVERLLVPDMALAVAEQFGVQGKRVLVLLTDMTAFADAMKEIAISMDQVPSNLGYPGSLYSDLASRYEKAVDFEGAGSITILAVTSMPGDDVTHPVPDNTGYITEGQFYLRNGVIEPFGSLSRLKQLVIGKVTRPDHGYIMNSRSDCSHAAARWSRSWPWGSTRRPTTNAISSTDGSSTTGSWTCASIWASTMRSISVGRRWPSVSNPKRWRSSRNS